MFVPVRKHFDFGFSLIRNFRSTFKCLLFTAEIGTVVYTLIDSHDSIRLGIVANLNQVEYVMCVYSGYFCCG